MALRELKSSREVSQRKGRIFVMLTGGKGRILNAFIIFPLKNPSKK